VLAEVHRAEIDDQVLLAAEQVDRKCRPVPVAELQLNVIAVPRHVRSRLDEAVSTMVVVADAVETVEPPRVQEHEAVLVRQLFQAGVIRNPSPDGRVPLREQFVELGAALFVLRLRTGSGGTPRPSVESGKSRPCPAHRIRCRLDYAPREQAPKESDVT